MAQKELHRPSKQGSPRVDSASPSPLRSIVGAAAVLLVAAAVLVVLWFSLSSRGHSVVGDAADQARVVVRGVESTLDRNLVDRSDVPWEADEVAHLLGWGSITLVVGFFLRSRRSLSDIAVGVFGASFGIEILQKLVTTSRKMEAEDVSANALGVIMGLMVLVAAERLLPPRTASIEQA